MASTRLSLVFNFVLALCALSSALACATPAPSQSSELGETVAQSISLPTEFNALLPWGNGPEQVRLQPAGYETVCQGPSAVAVAPDGRLLVLDRLAGRVVRIGADGQIQQLGQVPVDNMDLVAGADGSFAVYSPLRATARLFDPNGGAVGELAVPRIFRYLQSLWLGPSRQLHLRTGYQESINLGSPAAPAALATAIRSKKEGVVFLPDGRGVQSRVVDGVGELWVLAAPTVEQPRRRIGERLSLGTDIAAARIVGIDHHTVCLRLERTESHPKIEVGRRALCIDIASGQRGFDWPLPDRGLYLPRTELAVGAGRLAFIHPTAQGLRATSWRIDAEGRP